MEEIPLQNLSHLLKQVHVVTRETATNTDLDMCKFLGIEKALKCFKGEIVNNLKTSKNNYYLTWRWK